MAVRGTILSDDRGNSLVELALIAPLFAALLVGAVDLSRAYSAKLNLEQAAQRTIELIQRSQYSTAQKDDFEDDAEAAAGAGSTATVTAWLDCGHSGTALNYDTGTCANADDPYARYVQVTIQNSFTPMFGRKYFPGANANGTVTITATAGIRTQ